MAQPAVAVRKDTQFNWVGTDKKGNKLKGRSLATNEQSLVDFAAWRKARGR